MSDLRRIDERGCEMTYYLRTMNPRDRGNSKKDKIQKFYELYDAIEALKNIDEYHAPLVYLTTRKPRDYDEVMKNDA